MKKLTVTIFAALFVIGVFSGCNQHKDNNFTPESSSISDDDHKTSNNDKTQDSVSSNVQSENEDFDVVEEFENFTAEIVDKTSKQLGKIHRNSVATITDYGIFYTAYPENANDGKTIEYHIYDPKSNKDKLLGTLDNQSYEAAYARTELDNKIYTLVMTGELLDNEKDPLWLLEFDMSSCTMAKHKLTENGFPYTTMTVANGKLLIIDHDQQDIQYDRILEFDPITNSIKSVLSFDLSNDLRGDTLRQVYCDENNIYLLRLNFVSDSDIKMFLDTYDMQYNKQSEMDISSMLAETVSNNLAPEDFFNEMKQMANCFAILDGRYIYYENFSASRFLGDLKSGKLLIETDSLFTASSGSGKPLFFYQYGGNEIFELKDGKFEKSVFNANDNRYYITFASSSSDGSRLIQTDYINPDDRNDTLPSLLYYISVG
ncbi:MAG: hypothetical protein ACI4GV_05820 [Acutalibacteraceae bacterium]